MFRYYLELAWLSLKRNKVLTVLMVLAIAVGIGASMTTLTVMHILSGDPLPGRSAHLYYPQVDPTPNDSYYGHNKHPLAMMDDRSAEDLWSAHRADRQALVVDSPVKVRSPDSTLPPLMLGMTSTTSDFFPMFGVPFQYGGPWTPADDAAHARVAVISSDLNARLFGGRDSVGKTLRLKDSDVRIVGVLKPWRPVPRFYSIAGGVGANDQGADPYARPEDVFTPYFTGLDINADNFGPYTCYGHYTPGHMVNSPCLWVSLWVQLDSAAKAAAYRDFIANYAQQQKALGRFQQTDTRMLNLMGWLDAEQVIPSDAQLQMWLAFAFLVICLFNTVGLLLAKFLRRSGEIGVRRALGATRSAIFAQCLTEAGLIGFIGGVGGWLLTLLGLWLVRRQQTPYSGLIHMDTAMFVTTFALSIAVSLLAGALPALRASRIAPALQLKTL